MLLVSQMSYSELWKLWSAICVVCDVPYQLIFELLAGKVIESCKAFLLTQLILQRIRVRKQIPWGQTAFICSYINPLGVWHPFTKLAVGPHWLFFLVCCKRSVF